VCAEHKRKSEVVVTSTSLATNENRVKPVHAICEFCVLAHMIHLVAEDGEHIFDSIFTVLEPASFTATDEMFPKNNVFPLKQNATRHRHHQFILVACADAAQYNTFGGRCANVGDLPSW